MALSVYANGAKLPIGLGTPERRIDAYLLHAKTIPYDEVATPTDVLPY